MPAHVQTDLFFTYLLKNYKFSLIQESQKDVFVLLLFFFNCSYAPNILSKVIHLEATILEANSPGLSFEIFQNPFWF